jgi:hypothetical protein
VRVCRSGGDPSEVLEPAVASLDDVSALAGPVPRAGFLTPVICPSPVSWSRQDHLKFVLRPKELSGGLSDNDAPSRRVSDRDAGHHGSIRNAESLNAIYP